MNWPTIKSASEASICFWKYLLSFRKHDWSITDYPVRVRQNQPLEIAADPQFGELKYEPYLAQIMKWWVLSAGGDSPEQARAALAVAFESEKAERQRQGKMLPRPGESVPIEFAAHSGVDQDPELRDDFVHRALGVEWAWISDESSLWDFHTETSSDLLIKKIRDIYGVDVADIKSGNISEILARISASRTR